MARKLGRSPGEIIDFLQEKGIETNEGSNARLDDRLEELVIRQFAPSMWEEMSAGKSLEPEMSSDLSAPETSEDETVTPVSTSNEEVTTTDLLQQQALPELTPSDVPEDKVDVIKAPKVELPGLKVVGKIDLPEPKKKEPIPADAESTDQETRPVDGTDVDERRNRRYERGHNPRKKKMERPRKNSVVLKRERDAREEAKKKQAVKEKEKERRTQNYLKKVKPSAPTRPLRIIDEQVIEMSEEFEVRTPPRTIWGKFVQWLRRE